MWGTVSFAHAVSYEEWGWLIGTPPTDAYETITFAEYIYIATTSLNLGGKTGTFIADENGQIVLESMFFDTDNYTGALGPVGYMFPTAGQCGSFSGNPIGFSFTQPPSGWVDLFDYYSTSSAFIVDNPACANSPVDIIIGIGYQAGFQLYDVGGSSSSTSGLGCFVTPSSTCTNIEDVYFRVGGYWGASPPQPWATTTPPVDFLFTQFLGNYEPEVGYFNPATSTPVTLSFDYTSGIPEPSMVGIELQNIITNLIYLPQYESVIASGNFTFSTSTPVLETGLYRWRAVILGDDFAFYSPWRIFSIGTSQDQSFIPTPDEEEYGCEMGNWLTNTLCTFAAWLFIPSPNALNGILEVWQGMRGVKPFGYVIQVIEIRGSMTLATPNYSIGTLPLQTVIFDPLRTGIAIILWALFLFYLYHRFKTLEA
jgi:hypothetical protein